MEQQLDRVSRLYILAALRVGQDNDMLVDAYCGPEALRHEASDIDDPFTLISELRHAISDVEDGARRDFLTYQAQALETVARATRGERLPFREHVRLLYDIEPIWTDDDVFTGAHRLLDDVLPGHGTLGKRRAAFRDRLAVPADKVLTIVASVVDELSRRTRRIVDLPDGETVDIALVSDKPWSGYNWYLGNLRSRVELNIDRTVQGIDLLNLVAHEAYPGHHTEQIVKEDRLLRRRGYGETLIALLMSPQAVVAEGIATNALDVVTTDFVRTELLENLVLRPAGIDIDATMAEQVATAASDLSNVLPNAAIMLHERGENERTVLDYVQHWGLYTESEARSRLQFAADPEYGRYISNYAVGKQNVARYLDASTARDAAFATLMTQQWTPSRLRAATGITSEPHPDQSAATQEG